MTENHASVLLRLYGSWGDQPVTSQGFATARLASSTSSAR